LEALNLDVVLLNHAPQSDALRPFVTHRLAERSVSLVGTPERLAEEATLTERLRRHPIILPTLDSSVRSGFDALTDRLGVQPQIVAEVEDMAMMRLLAREDIGLAVLPPIVVKDEIAGGVLLEGEQLFGIVETFYAVTMTRRFPNHLLRMLLEQAKARGYDSGFL
jgi:LysR family transcriptional activator of nhaA